METPHTRPEIVAPQPLLDRSSGTLTVDSRCITLTRSEQAILDRLMRSEGQVVSRNSLFETLYGSRPDSEIPGDKTIDVLICKLRAKTARAGAGTLIETIWGRGWRIAAATAHFSLALTAAEWTSLQVVVSLAAQQNAAAAERIRTAMQRAA